MCEACGYKFQRTTKFLAHCAILHNHAHHQLDNISNRHGVKLKEVSLCASFTLCIMNVVFVATAILAEAFCFLHVLKNCFLRKVKVFIFHMFSKSWYAFSVLKQSALKKLVLFDGWDVKKIIVGISLCIFKVSQNHTEKIDNNHRSFWKHSWL